MDKGIEEKQLTISIAKGVIIVHRAMTRLKRIIKSNIIHIKGVSDTNRGLMTGLNKLLLPAIIGNKLIRKGNLRSQRIQIIGDKIITLIIII